MNPLLTSTPTPAIRAALADRMRRAAPELDPASERWKVGLVVLAATRVPRNVDRLAAAAGVPRELAAKVARRLFDHGLGAAELPDPVDTPARCDAFWHAVEVGEGVRAAPLDPPEPPRPPRAFLRPESSRRATSRAAVAPAAAPAAYAAAAPAPAPASRGLPDLFPGTHWLS